MPQRTPFHEQVKRHIISIRQGHKMFANTFRVKRSALRSKWSTLKSKRNAILCAKIVVPYNSETPSGSGKIEELCIIYNFCFNYTEFAMANRKGASSSCITLLRIACLICIILLFFLSCWQKKTDFRLLGAESRYHE